MPKKRLSEASASFTSFLSPRAHGAIAPSFELDVLVEPAELPVDADLGEPARAQRRQLLLEFTLAPPHDRREDVDALLVRREHHHVDDAFERLRGDRASTQMTVRDADI